MLIIPEVPKRADFVLGAVVAPAAQDARRVLGAPHVAGAQDVRRAPSAVGARVAPDPAIINRNGCRV
jgi:hypothetical protein